MGTKGKPHLTPREQRSYRALGTIMRGLGIADSTLAAQMGDVTRSTIQQRRTGFVKLRQDQLEEMADALAIPVELFDMDPPAVLRWLADNRGEQVLAASGWLSEIGGESWVQEVLPLHLAC